MPVMLRGADDRFLSSAMLGGSQTADHKRRWSAPRLRHYCALFPPQTTGWAQLDSSARVTARVLRALKAERNAPMRQTEAADGTSEASFGRGTAGGGYSAVVGNRPASLHRAAGGPSGGRLLQPGTGASGTPAEYRREPQRQPHTSPHRGYGYTAASPGRRLPGRARLGLSQLLKIHDRGYFFSLFSTVSPYLICDSLLNCL